MLPTVPELAAYLTGRGPIGAEMPGAHRGAPCAAVLARRQGAEGGAARQRRRRFASAAGDVRSEVTAPRRAAPDVLTSAARDGNRRLLPGAAQGTFLERAQQLVPLRHRAGRRRASGSARCRPRSWTRCARPSRPRTLSRLARRRRGRCRRDARGLRGARPCRRARSVVAHGQRHDRLDDGLPRRPGGRDDLRERAVGRARGAVLAAGRRRRVDGGYKVNGSYSFGSGSGHADWIGGWHARGHRPRRQRVRAHQRQADRAGVLRPARGGGVHRRAGTCMGLVGTGSTTTPSPSGWSPPTSPSRSPRPAPAARRPALPARRPRPHRDRPRRVRPRRRPPGAGGDRPGWLKPSSGWATRRRSPATSASSTTWAATTRCSGPRGPTRTPSSPTPRRTSPVAASCPSGRRRSCGRSRRTRRTWRATW